MVCLVERPKVNAFKLMTADALAMAARLPNHEKELKKVADAMKYSDPVGNPALAAFEERIHRKILELEDGENIPGKCAELLLLIEDRNNRVRLMK